MSSKVWLTRENFRTKWTRKFAGTTMTSNMIFIDVFTLKFRWWNANGTNIRRLGALVAIFQMYSKYCLAWKEFTTVVALDICFTWYGWSVIKRFMIAESIWTAITPTAIFAQKIWRFLVKCHVSLEILRTLEDFEANFAVFLPRFLRWWFCSTHYRIFNWGRFRIKNYLLENVKWIDGIF